MTHSFDVMDPGVAGAGEAGAIEGLAARAGARGAMEGAGVPAGASGVDIAISFLNYSSFSEINEKIGVRHFWSLAVGRAEVRSFEPVSEMRRG